jgi:hypothetical protein
MNGTANFVSFSYWFRLFVKNKMAGPALSVAGLAIGFLLLQLTRTLPPFYSEHVGFLGLRLMDVSTAVLCVLIIAFGFFWLRFLARRKTFP